MEPHPTPPTLALVRDLMFMSKIRAESTAAGVALTVVREPAKLGLTPGRALLVDLTLPGALEAAAAWKQSQQKPVIGFVGHTETETIEAARVAGIDQVLTRGQFTGLLPQIFKQFTGE